MIVLHICVETTDMYLSVTLCIMTDECELILIMTWLLDLVKVDFHVTDMLPWSLEHVIDMCEQL